MKRKLSLYVSVLLWVPALLARLVLIMWGPMFVPLTSSKNFIYGNNEHPKAPSWYRPGWKEVSLSFLAFSALWTLVLWFTPYRIVLFWVVGAIFMFHLMEGLSRPLRANYLWRVWRNPANNVRFWFEEPKNWHLSNLIDPEEAVRVGTRDKAHRWTWTFPFAEYWRVWRTKKGEIAEFRIGWKFSDVPGFGPTIQWRKGD